MSFQWSVRPTVAWGGLSLFYANAIRRAVRQIAERYAPEIEAYMKENAPWTDRSANARQNLSAEVDDTVNEIVNIIVAHGMEYGWYLEGFTPEGIETMQGGTYAIVNPTIDIFGPRIWADVQAMLQ